MEDSADETHDILSAMHQHPLHNAMVKVSIRERRRLWETNGRDGSSFGALAACMLALYLQLARRLLLMLSFVTTEVTPLGLGLCTGRARTVRRSIKSLDRSIKARETLAKLKSRLPSLQAAETTDADLDVDFEAEIRDAITDHIGAGAFGQVYKVGSLGN